VLDALRRGRTFTILPAIAGPAVLEFTATQSGVTVGPGGRLSSLTEPVTFRASVPDVPGVQFEIVRNDGPGPAVFAGRGVAFGKGSDFTYEAIPSPGFYRVEATLNQPAPWYKPSDKPPVSAGSPPPQYLPWLFSNPIYVDGPVAQPPPLPLDVSEPGRLAIRTPLPLDRGWGIEHASGSSGEVVVEGDGLRFGFQLGAETRSNPYAALVAQVDASQSPIRRVEFVARADRPTRLSIQVRVPGASPDGLRWGHSIYLDDTPRTFAISLHEFEQIGPEYRPRLLGSAIRSFLFVVDTVNAAPGTRGTVWISNPAVWAMPVR